jgi:RNA polymerase sigma factor (sigma-70 family)
MRTEDGHIIYQCLEGDSTAFGLLVDKYKASIYALAYSKLGNFHDAEDVTQEVFIKAYRKLKTLKNRDNFLAWLYAITSNLCKNWIKARERRLNHEINEEENIKDHLSVQYYHDNEIFDSLHEALELLPESYKQVLVLYYLGDMDGKEIAKFLGTSQNAIMLRLSRARSQLREEMVTMMKNYEAQRLPVSFTFRIVEIIKRITIRSTPGTPWISWGVSLTAGLIFTFLSLNSPQTSFNPLKAFSELSVKIGIMDVEWFPSVNQNSHNVNINAEISVEPLVVSKGLKGNALAGSGIGDESKTETPSQTSIPAVTDNVEMQTVSGKVLRDDNPVPNAQVTVYLYGTSNKYEGTTEKDGTFKIEVPKPNDNLKWDRVSIVANLSRYSFNWAEVSKDETSNIIMKLPKPATISGIVSDKSDKPILGAEAVIAFFSFDSALDFNGNSFLQGGLVPNSRIRTDSDGKFAFRNLPEGVKVRIEVTGQGYTKEIKNSISAGTEGITIRLKPEGRIEGRITYGDTGKPAEGIQIYAPSIADRNDYGNAITDANGQYVISNLKAGQYNVLLQPGYAEWTTIIAVEGVKVTEGQTIKDVNLTLIKGGIINGKVIDKDTNEPISGQWIDINDRSQPGPDFSFPIYSGKDGTFQFRATPGKVKVYTNMPQQGYEPVSPMEKIVDVVEGGTVTDVNFEFQKVKTFTVKGTVFTPDGDPVAGAIIADAWEWYRQIAVSDKDGKFTISGLRQGQKITVNADQKELHLRGATEIQVPPDEDIEIITEQYETTSIIGRVVNRKGEPIASADMMIFKQESEGGVGNSAGIADSSGNYKIDNLIVGDEYYVNAKADGYKRHYWK